MADFLDFELEDLSEAFADSSGQYGRTSHGDRIEIGMCILMII